MSDRLIKHAEDVFRRKGFHGASVQDITRAAGVPKGLFYNHFATSRTSPPRSCCSTSGPPTSPLSIGTAPLWSACTGT
ncbi:TetR/AcrR family transcriptional regulator [Streptomyces sp. NPDC057052]|uniref:TetR/AcrR family transcriptional regulator n=1 Tax=Streptomyces sp. NPDC057052 TaxID=3346010 RepID=UPI003636682E